jgi:aspartyl-tRNA(Asn)/glutamyl-tRNA(Gln) amidotransferase subunit A
VIILKLKKFYKNMINFKKTTIKELHKKLVSGEVSSSDLVKYSKSIIAEKDGDINAIIEVFDNTFSPDVVTETSSLLAGIPVAVKDNILFKGNTATSASKILGEYKATYDSKIAEIFRTAGVSLVGRANMDEMAMGTSTETSRYGATKNPYDLERVPGGSSGGPAAAVASGMVPYALGSDTGGSIRQPASLCGVVGLKPTYGAVSRRGLMAMSSSLDTIGPFANSVEDAEIVFNEIAQYDELDATSVSLEKRKEFQVKNENKKIIGVPRSFLEMDGIQKDVLDNFSESIEKMKEAGYEIIDIDLPLLQYSLAVYYIIQPAEVSSNVARYDGIRYGLSVDGKDLLDVYKKTKSEGFGKEVKRRIMLGTYVLSSG